mgnify:CR=1 FL=1
MKGVVYSTRTGKSAAANGQGNTILEIWFEDMGICVNQNNDVFRHNGPRKAMNHFGTMDFPAGFCDSIKKYIDLRENIETSNSKLFEVLRKKLVSHRGKHFTIDT